MSETLLRALVQGTLVIRTVACLTALPKLSTTVRAWLWRLVPVKFTLALVFTGALALPLLAPEALPEPLPEPAPTVAPLPEPAAVLTPLVSAPAPSPFPWKRVVLAVYGLGVLVALVRLGVAFWRTQRWQGAAMPLTSPELQAEAQRLGHSLGLRKMPACLVSSSLTSPGVVGVLRPRVILPESLLNNPTACWAALAHELAHVQRRDLLWCVLVRFVGAFVWCHPLYWLSVRELCVAQELACDTLALRLAETTPALYGKTLLAFATGEPLPQAAVRLLSYPKNGRVGNGATVFTTDAQGRFERRVRASWRYRIEPEVRGYGLLFFPPYVNEQRQCGWCPCGSTPIRGALPPKTRPSKTASTSAS